jgi:hypothetical protein
MVQKATDIAVQVGSRIDTDSASSYRALKGYAHAFVAGVSQVLITYEITGVAMVHLTEHPHL